MMATEPTTEPQAAAAALARAQWCDRYLTRPMFGLALVFLITAAGAIHRIGGGDETHVELRLIEWSLLVLWPIFIVEATLRLFWAASPRSPWARAWVFLVVVLLPPARLGLRGYADGGRMWLPFAGWRSVDKNLRKTLERFFSVPMIVIALLVLPVLAMEYFWYEQVRAHFGLSLTLDLGSSVIWAAFALEFVIMFSVADNKVRYCLQNWMDLAVVALPLIDFLPILRLLRLTRVLQIHQISRIGRLYRLRGLLMKAWRAILLLEMIQRVLGNAKAKRLARLKELHTAKAEELEELRVEIEQLEKDIAKEAKPPVQAPR